MSVLSPTLNAKNIYVQSVQKNNKAIRLQISHLDLVQGGVLEFEMSSKPKKLKK